MSSTTSNLESVYPSAAGLECPWPLFEQLRDEAPVCPVEGRPGVYVVTRYDDVKHAFSHPELFSSVGSRSDMREDGFDVLLGMPAEKSRLMSQTDPPEVKAKRDLGFAALKPGRLAAYEPVVRGIVDDLIDGFIERGTCDLIEEFTRPLPARVVLHLVGVPDADVPWVRQWHTMESAGLAFLPPEAQAAQRETALGMAEYLNARIEDRLAEPKDDIITEVLQAQIERDGELDAAEVASVLSALIAGGLRSTGVALANIIGLLLENDVDLAGVKRDPTRIQKLIEEGLRLEPPVLWMPRRVVQDTELGGVELRAGSHVILLIGSANRDERRFSDAAGFDEVRENSRDHIAFGFGPHTCLGAPLGRLEIRIALERLIDRLDDLRLSGQLSSQPGPHFRQLRSLPVRFTPGAPVRAR